MLLSVHISGCQRNGTHRSRYTQICNTPRTDLLMNLGCTPKTRPVWPVLTLSPPIPLRLHFAILV